MRGANLLCCSDVLLLCDVVPPRALRGVVGGSGVPDLRWVTTVSGVNSNVVVHVADVPALAFFPWARPPLPLGGKSAYMLCLSALLVSSSC